MKVQAAKPSYTNIDTILNSIKEVLETGGLITGKHTEQLEAAFAGYIGTKYAIAVSSGSASLEIVARYMDVKGVEVIVPTNTFVSCPNSVLYAGGTPVFADMNPESFCIDVDDAQKKITSKTKGIMAVHLGGLPVPELKALVDICQDKGLFLIEDCSHAHGASIDGKKVGSFGNAGCFSMLATKIMTSGGTGGIITTSDEKLVEFAKSVRFHGGIKNNLDTIVNFGSNWLMPEISAILGMAHIKDLDKMVDKRNEIAEKFYQGLGKINEITFFRPPKNIKHGYYKVLGLLDRSIDRDKFREIMKTKYNVSVGALYPVICHLQPIYQKLGFKEGICPVAEDVMKHQFSLPVYYTMTDEEINYVVQSVENAISELTRS
jgi:dTDP-4-amino-4,6-dideoxygalactose transaminase